MCRRTPSLENMVKKVVFTCYGGPSVMPLGDLSHIFTPPRMAKVRHVELAYHSLTLVIATYMTLFPAIEGLLLGPSTAETFNFPGLTRLIAACGSLKLLSFNHFTVHFSDDDRRDEEAIQRACQTSTLDLTMLEELALSAATILNRGISSRCKCPIRSRPTQVPELRWVKSRRQIFLFFQLRSMAELILVAAPTAIDLALGHIRPSGRFFDRIAVFPALESLTPRIRISRHAGAILMTLPAGPNLAMLNLRVVLRGDSADEACEEDQRAFDRRLPSVFPGAMLWPTMPFCAGTPPSDAFASKYASRAPFPAWAPPTHGTEIESAVSFADGCEECEES
ncbi:hypothetical protein C8R43DRAFT_166150 [Mycena crocata]|nr:hypothetical protein C8R43DRAFT_166150 [Mycena crocata]